MREIHTPEATADGQPDHLPSALEGSWNRCRHPRPVRETSPKRDGLVRIVQIQSGQHFLPGRSAMHGQHREAAKLHELAAQAHRTAAEHNEKGDYSAAIWHAERALEYSDRAYQLAKEAHSKSGQIVSI
jgi:hypothetical protein